MVIGDINSNKENQQLANLSIEAIEDVDIQVDFEEFTPSAVFQDNKSTATHTEKCVNSLPIKVSEDDTTMVTPKTKSIVINQSKKVPKRKLILNNIVGNSTKLRKDQEDYVSRMLSHSKLLKDDEHLRRMEIADEEHKIKMEINKEKLNAAILEKEINQEKLKAAMLEREILEIRKAREAS